MTLLQKRIVRELPGTFDRKHWVIELEPWGVTFRQKRTKRTFPITWEGIFDLTMKKAAEAKRAERQKKQQKKWFKTQQENKQ